MKDWKQKAEDIARQLMDEKRTKAIKEEAKKIELKEKEDERECSRKLKKLQKKFHCHICGVSAQYPLQARCGPKDDDFPQEPSWDRPGDLWLCHKCNKWTCSLHIHEGICKECAEKT